MKTLQNFISFSMTAFLLMVAIPSCADADYQELENGVSLSSAYGTLTVTVPASGSIRVHCVPDDVELPQLENLIYT